MEVLWAKQLLLLKGQEPLLSAAGVQQGYPLGPFLFFCLAVHPVLKKLARSVVPLAYMDDIYLVSNNVGRLKEAVLTLKDDLEKLNLKVNFNKCRTSRQVPGLEEIAVDKELKVLGVPLSVDADRQRTIDKETGYTIEEIVKHLKDTQAEECAQHNTCFLFEDL